MSLYSEIHEQPACLANLLRTQRNAAEEIARSIHERQVPYVLIAARGTSENAGRYAKYLWGLSNGLSVALASPSMFTYYHHPPQLHGALVVGISQSGRSPDIVSVLEEGRRQGCFTLAITNAPDSPLACAADFVFDLQAGAENAVAATKTYTCELMALAMISAALSGEESRWRELHQTQARIQTTLSRDSNFARIVERYESVSRCVILGRGFNYATAYEWALKLKELCYVDAQGYSGADFQHGPIAIIDGSFPVLAIAPKGAVYDFMIDTLRDIRRRYSLDMVVLSNGESALELAETAVPLPDLLPEWISPLVSIIPAQMFSYHLARAKGCDTESPRGIHKVTETR